MIGRGSRTEQETADAVRWLLLVEATAFLLAAAIHASLLGDTGVHRDAAVAETVIAIVLITGLALARTPHPWPRRLAATVQAFALAGVLVGLFMIAVGVGPQSLPDVAYHVAILGVLVAGRDVCRPPRTRTPRAVVRQEEAR